MCVERGLPGRDGAEVGRIGVMRPRTALHLFGSGRNTRLKHRRVETRHIPDEGRAWNGVIVFEGDTNRVPHPYLDSSPRVRLPEHNCATG